MKHLHKHSTLLKKYQGVINRHCTVVLNRFGDSTNITGNTNIVALNSNTLILNNGNLKYYKIYSPKFSDECANNNVDILKTQKRQLKCNDLDSDASSDGILLKEANKKKRRRLISNSSTDTLILDDVSIGCSNGNVDNVIEDSNDTIYNDDNKSIALGSEVKNKSDFDRIIVNNAVNNKVALKEINVLYHKHIEKISSLGSENKSNILEQKDQDLLNRKVLSIGRKIMSKQGISSPGLLKYLEFKNLNIDWNINANVTHGKEMNYVHIMPKFTNTPLIADKIHGLPKVTADKGDKNTENSNSLLKNLLNSIDSSITRIGEKNPFLSNLLTPIDSSIACNSNTPENISGNNDNILTDIPKIINNSQLLNATPVPNPKQAPKKRNNIEPKVMIVDKEKLTVDPNIVSSAENNCISLVDSDDDVTSFKLPVISHTTSLAPTKEELNDGPSNLKEANMNSNSSTPRIKCKPVTELMSPTALNNLSKNIAHQEPPHLLWNCVPDSEPSVTQNMEPKSNNTNGPNMGEITTTVPSLEISPLVINEVPFGYLKLNTVTMPNTITNSPFNYLKNLIDTHGLTLLNSDDELPSVFNCLVKFKLAVKQDGKSIILSLSLHSSKHYFCIKVKDSHHENVNMDKMSTFWQWEVIKSFHDTIVIDKIIAAAEKIGETEHAKLFVSIVNAIELVSK